MTTGDTSNGMETRISEWRACVRGRGIPDSELEEQERLLRGEAAALEEAGLEPEEAFLFGGQADRTPRPAVGQVRPGGSGRIVETAGRRPGRGCRPDRSPGGPSSFSVWLPLGPRG